MMNETRISDNLREVNELLTYQNEELRKHVKVTKETKERDIQCEIAKCFTDSDLQMIVESAKSSI